MANGNTVPSGAHSRLGWTKHPHIFGGLLTAGIILFSGMCYTVVCLEDRKYAWSVPIGGFSLIAAWASLLF